jgi:hypothetical protein
VFGGELLFRLDMNEHFRYLGQFLKHGVLHQMGNAVSITHGEFSFNDDVQVNVETETHFPHEAFVKSQGCVSPLKSERALDTRSGLIFSWLNPKPARTFDFVIDQVK